MTVNAFNFCWMQYLGWFNNSLSYSPWLDLLTMLHWFSMGFKLIKHSDTIIIKASISTFGTTGTLHNLLEKKKSTKSMKFA